MTEYELKAEFERIESMRHAHYAASELPATTEVDVNEVETHLCQTPSVEAQCHNYQKCGGGRRVLRKRAGE